MRYYDDFVGYSNFLPHFFEGYQIETSPNALEIIVVVF